MLGFLKWRPLLQNVGASDVDQVQEDVHKLAWNILLNGKHKEWEAENGQNIYSSNSARSFKRGENDDLKQCHKPQEVKQEKATGAETEGTGRHLIPQRWLHHKTNTLTFFVFW